MAASAAGSLTFTTGEAVKKFLLGRWRFSRKLDYRMGGGRGTMVGSADFQELSQKPGALLYEEKGMVELEGMGKPFEAYRKYLFNTNTWPVEVYFVDDPSKKSKPSLIPELDFHTSYFIPLMFEEVKKPLIEARPPHLCIDDIYSGAMSIHDESSFEWRWSITGPKKDGDICAKYEREASSL